MNIFGVLGVADFEFVLHVKFYTFEVQALVHESVADLFGLIVNVLCLVVLDLVIHS